MTVITKNAFDAGPCLVKVWTYDYPTGAPAFSATMAKGQSQSFLNPNFGTGTTHLTVAVDANGIVTISSADQPYYQSRYGAAVTVTPVVGGVGASLTNVAGSTDPVVPVGSSIYKKFSYVSPDIPVNAGAVYLGDGSIGGYAFASMPLSAGMNFLYPGGSGSSLGATPFVLGSFALMVDYPPPVVVAPDESLTTIEGTSVSVTPVITQDGNPVTPDSLAVVDQPTHGTASVDGASLVYLPMPGYFGTDVFTYDATVSGAASNVATVSIDVLVRRNCDCDDANNNRMLLDLRGDLMRRLGFGERVANPPPGMTELLNSFLIGAQKLLYRRYEVLRTRRFFSWKLQEGVRFYDVDANGDICTKRLDPRKITWVGIEREGIWYPLINNIPPTLYTHDVGGFPQRYEIRQCIELWPTPDSTPATLYVKGDFGLEPFAEDTDKTTIDDELVFLLALANAKSHYRQPDASNYVQEMETYLRNLVSGTHQTRRYIPGRDKRFVSVYVEPKPVDPWP